MTALWDFEKIKHALAGNSPQYKYLITDDRDEFLNRLEEIAKRGLLQNGDNLKCLEILAAVEAVRNGADIVEQFPILNFDNYK